ncbi:MAG: 6-phosphogluconolactonase [Pseudomonadota bacterium]
MAMRIDYPDRDALAKGLAASVADTLRARLEAAGAASLAVPGGSTPAAFLSALGEEDLDWRSVTVLATDERWAPPDHPRSNERMIRETLMSGGAAPKLHSYWRGGTPGEAVGELAEAFAPALPLDVCVLGMGADMHCASLFPGADALPSALEPDAPPVMAITAPGAPEPRVTLTARFLAGAGRLDLLITGDEKARVLDAALASADGLTAPISAVLSAHPEPKAHWAP